MRCFTGHTTHFHADRLTVMCAEKWGEQIREIGEETLGFAESQNEPDGIHIRIDFRI